MIIDNFGMFYQYSRQDYNFQLICWNFLELFRQITPYLPELFFFLKIFFSLSIVRHASTQCRTPAPRGMASQHLRTFERVPAAYSLFAGTVPATYSLFECTVPAFNLFLIINGGLKYSQWKVFYLVAIHILCIP